MDATSRKSVIAAIVLSSMLHLALFTWFMTLQIGRLVIPAERAKTFRSFEAKRVEMPSQSLHATAQKLPNVSPPLTPTPPLQALPEPGKMADPSAMVNLPSPVLPDFPKGAVSEMAPKIIAPPSNLNPYTASSQANLSTELSKFPVGPDLGSLAVANAALPSNLGDNPQLGTPPPGGGGQKPSGEGSAIPSLDQIQAQFRISAPTLDPNLPEPVMVRLPGDILFEFNSFTLSPGADPTLQLAVEYIQKYPRAEIQVDGHTDTIGEADYNMTLSQQRAQTVLDWLKGHMTGTNYRFVAKGWGESRPIVNPQGNAAEQKKNRRVEIIIRAVKA